MSPLSETDFNRRIDETLLAVEEAVDASAGELDYENAGGILTLYCPDGSQLILNRQTPVRQLWLAARSGGYHFDWDDADKLWRLENDGRPLFTLLAELVASQCSEHLSFG